MTFTPLPVMFFNRNIKNCRLVSENKKFQLFEKYGVDFIINIKFNKNFSRIHAEKFVEKIIYRKINPKFISVSNNFRFGYRREGDMKLLKYYQSICDYKLIYPKPLKKNWRSPIPCYRPNGVATTMCYDRISSLPPP